MKKNWLSALAILISLSSFAQQAKHVLLITIDGFRPDFYLEEGWHTPTLRALLKEGFHAKGVNSVFPSMTYPSHTTIVTGTQPARHGVYYNGVFSADGTAKDIYWQDSSIHQPTLWKAAHDKGLKVAAIQWPVSANAPVDYNIPDIGGLGEAVREQYSLPAGFINQLKQDVFNGDTTIKWGKDQNIAKIAAYIISKDMPALTTMHLFSVDHYEHEQGRTGNLVEKAISDADEAVSIVIKALKKKGVCDNTLLIVTGDHGFVTVTKKLNPNAWLKKAGLLNNIKKGDWKAQFNYSGGSAYLYLKDKNDKTTLAAVQQILQTVPDSLKSLFRVIDRKKMDEAGANPEVAFALSAEDGVAFGGKPTEEVLLPGKGGTHGYFPDFDLIRTGFIARGPGIKAGASVSEMNLRDIAPLVAKALGLTFPSAEGKIPQGILK